MCKCGDIWLHFWSHFWSHLGSLNTQIGVHSIADVTTNAVTILVTFLVTTEVGGDRPADVHGHPKGTLSVRANGKCCTASFYNDFQLVRRMTTDKCPHSYDIAHMFDTPVRNWSLGSETFAIDEHYLSLAHIKQILLPGRGAKDSHHTSQGCRPRRQ